MPRDRPATKVIKPTWGRGSGIGITLPEEFHKFLGLEKGDRIELRVSEGGKVLEMRRARFVVEG